MTEPAGVDVVFGHRVSSSVDADALGPDGGNTVRPDALAAWLDRRREWRALRCEDLERSDLPQRSYMLTLDDGYRDNLTEALPLLEKYDVPALIFITTGFVDGDFEPAESALARLIGGVDLLRGPGGRELACADPDAKLRTYESLRQQLKKGGVGRRDQLLRELHEKNAVEPLRTPGVFLDWNEVVELDRHPLVTIGAHTRTHPLLTRVSWREAAHEISESRACLEKHLGHPVLAFAYPYGGNNAWVRRMVSRAGFRLAFTTVQRPLQHPATRRRFRIPRRDLWRAIASDSA